MPCWVTLFILGKLHHSLIVCSIEGIRLGVEILLYKTGCSKLHSSRDISRVWDEQKNKREQEFWFLRSFWKAIQTLQELGAWWKTEVVPQPFRIRYRSALWLRSNFLNPSEFPPCILTCSKKFLPWGWAICWAISWDVRGIWSIAPTKCRSLSERPPDLSVPQCVTLSVWERRNNFLTQSAEVTNAKVTNANAH